MPWQGASSTWCPLTTVERIPTQTAGGIEKEGASCRWHKHGLDYNIHITLDARTRTLIYRVYLSCLFSVRFTCPYGAIFCTHVGLYMEPHCSYICWLLGAESSVCALILLREYTPPRPHRQCAQGQHLHMLRNVCNCLLVHEQHYNIG